MIDFEVVEESIAVLPEYGRIPISFDVRTVLEVEVLEAGLQGFRLFERSVASPWVKNYDAYKNEGPTRWAKRWDISNWTVCRLYARHGFSLGVINRYAYQKMPDEVELIWYKEL